MLFQSKTRLACVAFISSQKDCGTAIAEKPLEIMKKKVVDLTGLRDANNRRERQRKRNRGLFRDIRNEIELQGPGVISVDQVSTRRPDLTKSSSRGRN